MSDIFNADTREALFNIIREGGYDAVQDKRVAEALGKVSVAIDGIGGTDLTPVASGLKVLAQVLNGLAAGQSATTKAIEALAKIEKQEKQDIDYRPLIQKLIAAVDANTAALKAPRQIQTDSSGNPTGSRIVRAN